jgi:Domain of unknown function (DUF3362)
MGRADLIGNGKQHLIPIFQPTVDGTYVSARRKNSTPASSSLVSSTRPSVKPMRGRILTQHTGLPPRDTGSAKAVIANKVVGKVAAKSSPKPMPKASAKTIALPASRGGTRKSK